MFTAFLQGLIWFSKMPSRKLD